MLDIPKMLKILNSYNINSHKYGPTVYKCDSEIGLCMDIKDSYFSFLTRLFVFKRDEEVEDFLNKYFWYKKNKDKYPIRLKLDEYNKKITSVKYFYEDKDLNYEEMRNLNNIIDEKKENLQEENLRKRYLTNITSLTNYVIDLKKTKLDNRLKKNDLKIKENDLKYDLLVNLAKYYEKNKIIEKKIVTLENMVNDNNEEILKNNLENIKSKTLKEIENYLRSLIDICRVEEADEKNLVNMFSNSIYRYNIEILEKQINFVKSKIASEENFNLKGSKIHNIDEELKSFLKPNNELGSVNVFVSNEISKINDKYAKIDDISKSSLIITGRDVEVEENNSQEKASEQVVVKNLRDSFDNLNPKEQAYLVLYNSYYKNICNYIINNSYPDIDDIKSNCNIEELYQETESLRDCELNSHFLLHYFNYLNCKNIDSFLNSLIDICRTLESVNFNLLDDIKAFAISDDNKYKSLTINPIYVNKKFVYLLDVLKNSKVIYIPFKLETDGSNLEISLIKSDSIYTMGNIIDVNEVLTVNKYNKVNEKYDNSGIIATKNLTLNKEYIFQLGYIEGVQYE